MENLHTLLELARGYLIQLATAIVILVVGIVVVRAVSGALRRALSRGKIDATLRGFLVSVIRAVLTVAVVLSAASTAGIEMTSFVAVLGAAGLAVGLAFQGTLSNFAGGVLILAFRPFSVGDFIEASGFMGSVKEIQILYTILHTPDNRRVVIPNGALANAAVTNFSANTERRIDLTYSISYSDSIEHAKRVLADVLSANEKVLQEPAPVIGVAAHGASSIDILVRFWTPSTHFLAVQHELNQTVKERFDTEGISIPFPQRDVYIKQASVTRLPEGSGAETPV